MLVRLLFSTLFYVIVSFQLYYIVPIPPSIVGHAPNFLTVLAVVGEVVLLLVDNHENHCHDHLQ
jgi:hypothetical protein